jgi:hypothetical protein
VKRTAARWSACEGRPGPRYRPRCFAALALPLCFGAALRVALEAQEPSPALPAPAAEDRPEERPAAQPPPAPESYRLLGPPLFPFYDHYLRNADQTEVLNILYLYQSTQNPAGDASNLLFPFYYWERKVEPPDRRLYLFPLLFYHRQSAEASFNVLAPLLYDYRTPSASHQGLIPIWFRNRDIAQSRTSHHVLFPFSRLRFDGSKPDAPAAAFRLGLWKILEVFEIFRRKADSTRLAFLSLFNWGEEAESRIALFHSSSRSAGTGPAESRTHLFPFLWQGRDADSSYFHLLPFFLRGASGSGEFLWVLPFAGLVKSASSFDFYVPFALSRVGESADGEVRRDFLWPLYHRRYGPGRSSFYSLPFFTYDWTPERRDWRLFLILYGNEHYPPSGKTAHSVLWPLGRFDVEPDGVSGHRRLIPFYFDDFTDARRWIVTPLFLQHQRRSGAEKTWDFTFALPDYFGWGSPDDYFGFGFPLYWKSRSGRTGWDLFLPIYFSFFRASSFGVHVLPLVSYNRYPSESQLFLLGPTFVHRRFKDFEEKPAGSSTSVIWPLTAFESRRDGYYYRFLPLFWTSRDRDERDLLLFPFWYRQWGGGRSQNYFFAAYGRYETERLRRDFYGLGSYIHTREKGDGGEVVRDRKDVLWSLASFQTNSATGERHQRFLPLGIWNTTSLDEDRGIFGPFFYHHRIEDEELRQHRLKLVLGNLFLSKTVTRTRTPPPHAAAGAAARESAAPAGPVVEEVSRERGILWPLLRSGYDRDRGVESQWAAPVYFNRVTRDGRTRAFFPFAFLDHSDDIYDPSYFRHFYLFDRETWAGGQRLSVGQVLFDRLQDLERGVDRWRFLYPLTELQLGGDGWSYQLTPLIQGKVQSAGGQQTVGHFFFPFYWFGHTAKQKEDRSYEKEHQYLYFFPFFGINKKSLRSQFDFLLPFFHTERGLDSFKFQFRPFLFLRSDPEEFSVRTWPLNSYEKGEAAGEWWVSKYLYFSKLALRERSWSYRLDPFIFRLAKDEDSFGIGGLFEILAYDQKGSGEWTERSFRALPFIFGFTRQRESSLVSFPLYYGQDFGDHPIDRTIPWRFFFIANHLRSGNGDRLTSVLWKLFEYHDNPRRPEHHEFRILHAFIQHIHDVSFRQYAVQPFFFYSSNETDPTRPERTLFILPLLGYRYNESEGQSGHYLFWFVPLWWK